MNLQQRIDVLSTLGMRMKSMVNLGDEAYAALCIRAYLKNNWFTKEYIEKAMLAWSDVLTTEGISDWLKAYVPIRDSEAKKIGVINAGNIPLVGLHDFISVLLCGHTYIGKNSSEDNLLLPFIASILTDIEPMFKKKIQFVEKLAGFDAVIATGSNNSSRYFESYFARVPNIIRKNRSGVAVLSGNESKEEFEKLGRDIFQYFGLGCRNVSKVFVPQGYNFKNFFEGIFGFNAVMQHNKYMNNFDYNNAMLLMKLVPFLQNEFLIIHEDDRIASPISVVHYEKYNDHAALLENLDAADNRIQCVVTNEKLNLQSSLRNRMVFFGNAQSPSLNDYADGVDTIRFLLSV